MKVAGNPALFSPPRTRYKKHERRLGRGKGQVCMQGQISEGRVSLVVGAERQF